MSDTPAQPQLPGNLKSNPRLGQWLRVDPRGYVELCPGKVEIGQGIITALVQIAAEELDINPSRIRLKAPNTAQSPNEGVTSGSLSIQDSGSAIRHASAEARAIYIAAAAEKLGVDVKALHVEDGTIHGPDNLFSNYWELANDALLDRDATPGVKAKASSVRSISGAALQRLDIPEKIFGEPRFIHDKTQADVLHGRIMRPPSPAASLKVYKDTGAKAVDGVVDVVRDGNFLGVVASTEHAADIAIKKLQSDCTWDEPATLPDENNLGDWLRSAPTDSNIVATQENSAPPKVKTVTREFTRPYVAHASIGLCCAAALWKEGKLTIWSHCQGIFHLRADIALVFKIQPDDIIVEHMEGAGCYGHNGADDVGLDAALLARAVPGKRVRVQWSRHEEIAWAPLSPAMAVTIEAGLDASGEIVDWRHQVWSNGHASRPGRADSPALLSAYYLQDAWPRVIAGNIPLPAGGADRNAVPAYNFPNFTITNHRLTEMPLRTSALRSLGATANVFAVESMMDELAAEAGEDPVGFRLRHLEDERGRAVIEAVANRADWANREKRKQEGTGYGVGYAKYKNLASWCAAIAEVEAGEDIRVVRLTIAVDAGEVINPDGLSNQIEGGAVQTVSWILKEAVRFDDTHITSVDWETYPILKFSEVPQIDVEIINHPNERSLGAGEAPHGPVAGAVANAIRDAVGVRIYDLPLTFDRIVKAINEDT